MPPSNTPPRNKPLGNTPSSNPEGDWLEIGRVVAPQGLQGELRVYPNSDFPERFLVPGTRWLQQSPQETPKAVELLAGRFMPQKGIYVIRLAGFTSRDAAEALRNASLLVPSGDRPPLEAGEYHVSDLVGLAVYDQATGQPVGTVVDIREAGNDLLEVALTGLESPESLDSSRRALIPFVEPIVPVVDLAQRRIEITPPPGLLDLA